MSIYTYIILHNPIGIHYILNICTCVQKALRHVGKRWRLGSLATTCSATDHDLGTAMNILHSTHPDY